MTDDLAPKRIQRRRTKGWRMPEGAIYVGRPSRWGNPFHGSPEGRQEETRLSRRHRTAVAWRRVAAFEDWILRPARSLWFGLSSEHARDVLLAALPVLRGHDLVCWCPLDQPCHADVLLDLANR